MENISAYRTKDGEIFFDEIEAKTHENLLDNKKILASFELKNAIIPPYFTLDENEVIPTRIMQHNYRWYKINDIDAWKQFVKLLKKEFLLSRVNFNKIKNPLVFPTIIGVDSFGRHNILSEEDILNNYKLAKQRQLEKLDMIDKEFETYQKNYYELVGRKLTSL